MKYQIIVERKKKFSAQELDEMADAVYSVFDAYVLKVKRL